jgi:hypothetical protein
MSVRETDLHAGSGMRVHWITRECVVPFKDGAHMLEWCTSTFC